MIVATESDIKGSRQAELFVRGRRSAELVPLTISLGSGVRARSTRRRFREGDHHWEMRTAVLVTEGYRARWSPTRGRSMAAWQSQGALAGVDRNRIAAALKETLERDGEANPDEVLEALPGASCS